MKLLFSFVPPIELVRETHIVGPVFGSLISSITRTAAWELFATQHVGYDRFLPPSLGGETCYKRKRPLRMLALDNLSHLSVILISLICMSQRFSNLKAHNVTLSF